MRDAASYVTTYMNTCTCTMWGGALCTGAHTHTITHVQMQVKLNVLYTTPDMLCSTFPGDSVQVAVAPRHSRIIALVSRQQKSSKVRLKVGEVP